MPNMANREWKMGAETGFVRMSASQSGSFSWKRKNAVGYLIRLSFLTGLSGNYILTKD